MGNPQLICAFLLVAISCLGTIESNMWWLDLVNQNTKLWNSNKNVSRKSMLVSLDVSNSSPYEDVVWQQGCHK